MDKKIVSVETESNMLDDKNNTLTKILKLFSGKYIRFIILVVLLLVGILILLPESNNVTAKQTSSSNVNSTFTTTLQYCSKLEEKLKIAKETNDIEMGNELLKEYKVVADNIKKLKERSKKLKEEN